MDTIEIAVGQRWQEVDPRFVRVIEVTSINRDGTASARTVYSDGTLSGREYRPKLTRFNGKRGGYKLTDADARSVDGSTS